MSQSFNLPAYTIREIKDYRANGVTQSGSSILVKNYGTQVLTSTDNPNYKVNIAKHVDAGSPFYRLKHEKFTPLRAFGSCTKKSPLTDYTGNLTIMPSLFAITDYTNVATGDFLSYRNIALKHIKNKLATKVGKYHALVPAAEIRDQATTYKSMCNLTAQFIIGALDAKRRLKKNPKRAVADFTDFISNAWLTYSFGIAPTVSDFEGLAESITSRITRVKNIRETGGSSYTFNVSKAQSVYLAGDFGTGTANALSCDVKGSYQYTLKYFYTAGRYIDMDQGGSGFTKSDQFGISWGQVVPAVYELIPYSWLLDYFTSAGDYINDIFDSPSGNTVYNYLTTVQNWNLTSSTFVSGGENLSSKVSHIYESPASRGFIVRRTQLSQLPHQSLRIKTANEISTNAGNKLANLFSLASPIFSRRLR